MEAFFIRAGQLLLCLSILVILHELGHFIPAKLFKTRVEKFFLFFDVKFALFKKKIGETVYGIGWLPLGGYVKIAGMIDESMDKEQMAQPAQPWEFRSKPAWQRLIIMIGGVTVNLILGILLYAMIFSIWGKDEIRPSDVPNGYEVSQTMKSYGFSDGDIPLKVNGKDLTNTFAINRMILTRHIENITVQKADGSVQTIAVPDSLGMQVFHSDKVPLQKIAFFEQLKPLIKEGENTLQILRGSQLKDLTITPKEGILGVIATQYYDNKTTHVDYSFFSSISEGISYGYWTLHDYAVQFKYIFTKKGANQVGGFASMAKMFDISWDWQRFWESTALISIILAFMNILPIPALDGGHIVFLIYEMITGRKPSEKVLEYAQMVGFFILLALLLYANGNDIYRWITGGH